jgi:hypothetical protein
VLTAQSRRGATADMQFVSSGTARRAKVVVSSD